MCELSEEERISVNVDGTFPPTAAPGGIAGAGIGFFQASKGESSGGVVAMIDLLIKDLGKELTEVEVDEKNAQARRRENHGRQRCEACRDDEIVEHKTLPRQKQVVLAAGHGGQ